MTTINLRIDGLTTAQKQAWQTIRPVLREYLPLVLRVYVRATPEQRAVIVAHSPAAVAWLFDMFDRVVLHAGRE